MEIKTLTKENFLIYAINNYQNSDCLGISEFTEDLSKIKHIKRLLNKYTRTGEVRGILLLNHIIILANVFGSRAASRMLFYKLEKKVYPALKTILLYLNYIEDNEQIDLVSIQDIPMDAKLYILLRRTIENEA